MAEEDVTGGMAEEGDAGDGASADEWVAPDEDVTGIQYVDEQGEPEPLPALMTASDLLQEDDPLASLPHEPEDELPPAPPFIIEPNAYGPRTPSIRLANGTPVGTWLRDEHPDLDGAQVRQMLLEMGLPDEYADWFGKHRGMRPQADAQIASHPAVQNAMAHEKVRLAQKAAVQEAFVKAQKEKAKKA